MALFRWLVTLATSPCHQRGFVIIFRERAFQAKVHHALDIVAACLWPLIRWGWAYLIHVLLLERWPFRYPEPRHVLSTMQSALLKDVGEKFIWIFQSGYSKSRSRVRVWGNLSLEFTGVVFIHCFYSALNVKWLCKLPYLRVRMAALMFVLTENCLTSKMRWTFFFLIGCFDKLQCF